jgi:peptidoglycan hydrolase CwlO-like protein
MLGVLSFTYSSMLQSVEHEALSTAIPKVQQLLQSPMSSGVFTSCLVLSASILTKYSIDVLIRNVEQFVVFAVMDDSSLQELCFQVQNIEAEMRSMQEKLEEVKYHIDINLPALLDERECLLSRVDPFSANGDSIADWIGR